MNEVGETGEGRQETESFRFSPRPNRASEIAWRHWGHQAFEEAAREGKLVFLSVSAAWCHWCHVMDETTYSDPGVISRLNRDFIPVRVDSDKRPDINRRYNQGGWPTTVLVAPSGRTVAGLTYAPPDQLMPLLDRFSTLYRDHRDGVDAELAAAGRQERQRLRELVPGEAVEEKTPVDVEAAILSEWDRGCGGIGEAPKFPPTGALEFALGRYLDTGDENLRAFAVSTLDGMRLGEIYDRVEGGFFRYAMARDWGAPHYEKLLGDNAALIYIYCGASVVLGRKEYAEVARGTLDYALRTLLDEEQRGFYGSQDADELYYHKDAAGRRSMPAPAVDRTIYVDSTSRMTSALSLAAHVLDDPVLLLTAERIIDYIWREGYRAGEGVCHYFEPQDGTPRLWGQPADQVDFLSALISLYQSMPDPRFLARAIELGRVLVDEYVSERGWVVEAFDSSGARGGGVLDDVPVDLPDVVVTGNAARALLALDELVPGHGFEEVGRRVVAALSDRYRSYSHFASEYALAVELLEKGFIEVRVSQNDAPDVKKQITAAAVAAFNPRRLVRLETVEDYMPEDEGTASPSAVVCSLGSCRPVYSVDELKKAMESLTAVGTAR